MGEGPLKGWHVVIQFAQVCRRIFIYAQDRNGRVIMARGRRPSDFAHAFSEALDLPRTAALIVGAPARARDALAVGGVVRRVRRSERSAREDLRLFLSRRVLNRS